MALVYELDNCWFEAVLKGGMGYKPFGDSDG